MRRRRRRRRSERPRAGYPVRSERRPGACVTGRGHRGSSVTRSVRPQSTTSRSTATTLPPDPPAPRRVWADRPGRPGRGASPRAMIAAGDEASATARRRSVVAAPAPGGCCPRRGRARAGPPRAGRGTPTTDEQRRGDDDADGTRDRCATRRRRRAISGSTTRRRRRPAGGRWAGRPVTGPARAARHATPCRTSHSRAPFGTAVAALMRWAASPRHAAARSRRAGCVRARRRSARDRVG